MQNIIQWFQEGGIATIVEGWLLVSALVTFVIGFTDSPRAKSRWATAVEWVGRIFSFVTHKNAGGTFKVPIVQSASKPQAEE